MERVVASQLASHGSWSVLNAEKKIGLGPFLGRPVQAQFGLKPALTVGQNTAPFYFCNNFVKLYHACHDSGSAGTGYTPVRRLIRVTGHPFITVYACDSCSSHKSCGRVCLKSC